jgi:Tetratricopeptide repeat
VAKLYFVQHRYMEAEPLYRRAIAIMEQSLGLDHPTLAQYLASYALQLERTQRKSEASAMKTRALAILAKGQGNRSGSQTVDVGDLKR